MSPLGLEVRHIEMLDALLSEQHVSRAAERLSLSQPAVSNALASMRTHFKDELLVRDGAKMVPTPFALELHCRITDILRAIRSLAAARPHFDPAETQCQFRVAMPPHVGALIMPALVQRLIAAAPEARLDCLQLSTAWTSFERGDLDLVVCNENMVPAGSQMVLVLQDHWCCMVGSQTRFKSGRPSRAELARLRLVLPNVELERTMPPLGIEMARNVSVPMELIPHVVAEGGGAAVVPASFAQFHQIALPLHSVALPFPTPIIRCVVAWHANRDHDPASQWLREQVLAASAPASERLAAFGGSAAHAQPGTGEKAKPRAAAGTG